MTDRTDTAAITSFDHTCKAVWTLAKAKLIDENSHRGVLSKQLALMDEAGFAVANEIRRRCSQSTPVLILCGRGNNGGDGLVVARLLAQSGYRTVVYMPRCNLPSSPAAQSQLHRLEGLDIKLIQTLGELSSMIENPRRWLLVDALMGLQFSAPLEDRAYLEALAQLNPMDFGMVCAVDLPSGVEAAGEQIHGDTIPADLTVTFGAKKIAHCTGAGPKYCGEVIVADIGFDPEVVDSQLANRAINHFEVSDTEAFALSPFRRLATDAHKYDRGHVLVLGGHKGMNGAAWLCAEAAYQSGAGWVSLSLAEPDTSCQSSEVVEVELWKSPKEIDWQELERFIISRKVKSLVIGPGLRQSPLDHNLMDLLQNLAVQNELYIHLDAGALEGGLEVLQKYPFSQSKRLSLSPHPGEWQKFGFGDLDPSCPSHHALLFTRLSAIGGRFLYKSARPMVIGCAGEDKFIGYCAGDLPQLAKAGTGDVLSGIIGALGGAGSFDREALILGYAMLKKAAVLTAMRYGEQGVTPKRLIAVLGQLS